MNHSRSHIPVATYRLQFNRHFTFQQAKALVPYLHALGISHVYSSPLFKANPGSLHGYDINDHNELNPEIGSREEFDAFIGILHEHGMGLIMDFVPNHMGVASEQNKWWFDVLENGESSVYASYFDIDWNPLKNELENRVLLPILGDQYGRVLELGEFKLSFENGAFFLHYYDVKLPLAPRSYAMILKPALSRLQFMEVSQEFLAEFQSVITALEHLPHRTETNPERIEERAREKEIIKRRLQRRCDECPEAIDAIEQCLREIEGISGDPRSFNVLDKMLCVQVYRLSFWRVAAEEINYRRFFDINELAAIRVEIPEVFEAAHKLTFELIGNGSIDGLRIDHVDGLWHPRFYLEELQRRTAELKNAHAEDLPLYLVVEKILLGEERLHTNWATHGTSGYEFANYTTRLLIDPTAEKSLTETYQAFVGDITSFHEIAHQKKLTIMHLSLASEINVLSHMIDRLSEKNRWYRDFTLNALRTAVSEFIACLSVYRTYVSPEEEPTDIDRAAVRNAVRNAVRRNPGIERSIFDFLGDLLLKKFPENLDAEAREEHMRFVMKFQQCTGPVMAKGVEDTAFYLYNRLTALNEVGGEPEKFSVSPQVYHERFSRQLQEHPHALLATSTHDTKRSEDVRARLSAISEMPTLWRKALRRWQMLNQRFKKEIDGVTAPDANEEFLLYQTLLGTWPIHSMTQTELSAYSLRIQEYIIKAAKEAKVNMSWIQPNEDWESALRNFVINILQEKSHRFLNSFKPVAQEIARLGAINALSQVVLKSTVPGVPDIYQGTELWNFTLVDPDNRAAVDYDRRKELLINIAKDDPASLWQTWHDGRIKLYVTQKLLCFRREHPVLFQSGEFMALRINGKHADCCFAFLRRSKKQCILVVVPRLTHRLGEEAIGEAWGDTALELPVSDEVTHFQSILSGKRLPILQSSLRVAEILHDTPVAMGLLS